METSDFVAMRMRLDRLQQALADGLNRTRCLRRWSEFVRERDGHRCVDCHATRNLSAHHICRKTFMPEAEYELGNGITLCRDCHRQVHAGFNGRPDLLEPMDAQGGEKLRNMERLYCILDQDADDRGMPQEEFYALGDQVLAKFKLYQGFAPDTPFPGAPVRQAYLIWAQTSLGARRAVAAANGVPMTDQPILPGEALVVWGSDTGSPTAAIIRNPRWY